MLRTGSAFAASCDGSRRVSPAALRRLAGAGSRGVAGDAGGFSEGLPSSRRAVSRLSHFLAQSLTSPSSLHHHSFEKEQISSEAMEAGHHRRLKYMVKNAVRIAHLLLRRPSTACASTRCFPAPVRIASRPVCVVRSVRCGHRRPRAIGQIMLSLRTRRISTGQGCRGVPPRQVQVPRASEDRGRAPVGFTKFSREDYLAWKAQGRICPDGVNAKLELGEPRPRSGARPRLSSSPRLACTRSARRRKSQPRRGFTLSDVMLLLINTE